MEKTINAAKSAGIDSNLLNFAGGGGGALSSTAKQQKVGMKM